MEKVKVDPVIFTTAVVLVVAVCIPLVIFSQAGADVVDTIFKFLTSQLGVLYLWAGIAVLGFLFWLAFSRHGNIVLGFEVEKPQFSLYSWVSMLFCGGVATGIFYFGTIEWVYYIDAPPYGAQPHSVEAIEWASTFTAYSTGVSQAGHSMHCPL